MPRLVTLPLCLVAWLILPRPAFGDAPAPAHIYQQSVQAIAWVRGAKPATGFFVDREQKLLITCAHTLGKDQSVQVVFPEFKDARLIAEREHYKKTEGIAGKVLAVDLKRDLALIQLPALPDGVRALPFAADGAEAGERLHAVGNADASEGLWGYGTGILRQVYRKKEAYQGLSLDAMAVVTQLPINAGDSGAPVVNDAGEVVGVAVGAVEKTRLVTFCIAASEVLDFVSKYRPVVKEPAPRAKTQAAETRASAADEPVRGLFEKLVPASCWVVSSRPMKDAGTGCVIDVKRRLALTALRVVGDDRDVRVWLPIHEKGKLLGQRDHYRKKVSPVLARVIHKEPRSGLAVLELESLPEAATELKLAAESPLPGQRVHSIGNPIHATGLWVFHAGAVRQRYLSTGKGQEPAARILEVQTPYNQGDAGGPLVNARGELVAIVEAAIPGTHLLTRSIDVSDIREVLKRIDKR